MSGTNRDALLIEQGAQVFRVGAFQQEAEHTDAISIRSKPSQAGNFLCQLIAVGEQLRFVGGCRIAVQTLYPFHRSTESNHSCYMWGACLEFKWNGIECGAIEADAIDHLAAAKERWHGFQQFASTPQCANAGWSK